MFLKLYLIFTAWAIHDTFARVNVIILTYRRSGSSYVGELLSSQEDVSYFFEPLSYAQIILNRSDSDAYRQVIRKTILCDKKMLHELRQRHNYVWVTRKFGNVSDGFKNETQWSPESLQELCSNSSVHVAKTIRLRMKDAYKLMGEIPNLRIIHLIRDPRARFASTVNKNGNWDPSERTVETLCGEMTKDLKYWQNHRERFNSSSYLRLRYEDIVQNPAEVAKQVYEDFYGIPFTNNVQRYIEEHAKAEKNPQKAIDSADYYSTYRNSTFNPKEWKNVLNATQLSEINKKCGYIIDLLNYDK